MPTRRSSRARKNAGSHSQLWAQKDDPAVATYQCGIESLLDQEQLDLPRKAEFFSGGPHGIRAELASRANSRASAFVKTHQSAGHQSIGKVLWLTSHAASAELIRQDLLAVRSAWLVPQVLTLRHLAERVVDQAGPQAWPLSLSQSRRLIYEVIVEAHARQRAPLYGPLAQRAGVIDQLLRQFSEFFQSDFLLDDAVPDFTAMPDRRLDLRRREAMFLYRVYRRRLRRSGLADADQRMADACELIRNPSTDSWQLTILSGFRHLSPLDKHLLKAVAQKSHRLLVEMGELDPSERGLWQPLEKDLRVVAAGYDETSEHSLPGTTFGCSDRRRTHELLFGDPRQLESEPSGQSKQAHPSQIKILAAESTTEELRSVARQIKQSLIEGIKPAEILVTARQLGVVARRVQEAFTEVGVPLAVGQPQRLGDATLMQVVLSLVRLMEHDWRFEDLLAVITNPRLLLFNQLITPQAEPQTSLFDTSEAGALAELAKSKCRRLGLTSLRAIVEWIVRQLALPSGGSSLVRLAQRGAERFVHANQDSEAVDEQDSANSTFDTLDAAAYLAAPHLLQLQDLLAQPLKPQSPLEVFDSWKQVLEGLGYRSPEPTSHPLSQSGSGAVVSASDEAALEKLEELYSGVEQLAGWQGKKAPQLSIGDNPLLLWASRETLPFAGEQEGCVRLLPAEAARYHQPRDLYIIGLQESSFPATTRDASGELALAGISAEVPEEEGRTVKASSQADDAGSKEEMLLFTELLASATRQVHLSYAALDEKAQPLNPSSYLSEVERLFPSGQLRYDAAVGGTSVLYSGRDLRIAAVRELGASNAKPLATLLRSQRFCDGAATLANGIEASWNRSHGDAFAAYEGILTSEAAQQRLASRYPPQHLWSPSSLELYATCPFKFFMRQVLGAEPLEDPVLDVDYRRRGSLLHDALLLLHRRLRDEGIQSAATNLASDAFVERFKNAVTEAQQAVRLPRHQQGLARVEAMQADAWGHLYRDQLAKYEQQERHLETPPEPTHFEVRFGPARHADELQSPLSNPEPFALDLGEEILLLVGQIDRIDIGSCRGETIFNVVDYKTSRTVKYQIANTEAGRQLQPLLYTLAAEQHLLADQAARPWRTGYWGVQQEGFKTSKNYPQPSIDDGEQLTPNPEWQTLDGVVRERLLGIVRGVRNGDFPMNNPDEHCAGQCEFSTTCRVAQSRYLGKRLADEVADDSADGVATVAASEDPR